MPQSPDKRGSLDSAFPSLIVMGALLALALALIFVCGWTIFALEGEREEISRERLLLERDRDMFLTYGGELPQMTERRRVLAQEAKELEERKTFLEKAGAELEDKRGKLDANAQRLAGAISELEARRHVLEEECGKARAELQALQPQREALRKDVAALKAQESGLLASIGQKQKQESALTAQVEGLERSRANAQELLARLTSDNEAYASFEKGFARLMKGFEEALAKSASLTVEYSAKLDNIEKSSTQMTHGLAALDQDRRSFGANLDALRKDRQAYAALLKQSADQNRAIQAQADALAGANRKLTSAMEALRGLDAKLQSALAAEVATLKKMAQEDSQTRASLTASAQALGVHARDLKNQLEQSQAAATNIGALLASQKSELAALAANAATQKTAMETELKINQQSLEMAGRLEQMIHALSTNADALKARLDSADLRGGDLARLLEEEAGRIKEIGALNRQLSEEVIANRRRAGRLEALLEEIQARLAPAKPEAPSMKGADPMPQNEPASAKEAER